jgi:hypothetical protein
MIRTKYKDGVGGCTLEHEADVNTDRVDDLGSDANRRAAEEPDPGRARSVTARPQSKPVDDLYERLNHVNYREGNLCVDGRRNEELVLSFRI